MYDFGARFFDGQYIPVWTSIDPLAEKYYSISPYTYCANNPVLLTDPTGEDIVIWYKENDKYLSFSFNGANYDDAPQNRFVQDVLLAYSYNIGNGEGESMKALAESTDMTVNVVRDTGWGNRYESSKNVVYWLPNSASKTAEGHYRSPATILEHEMDHARSFLTDPKAHYDRRETPDSQYDHAEERRVITGAEARTAQANGEYPKGYTRTDHQDHGGVRVSNPTLSKPYGMQLKEFIQKMQQGPVSTAKNIYKQIFTR